jgi:hypothetical protein
MNLLEFAKQTKKLLDGAKGKDFAPLYIEKRIQLYRNYSNGLIQSSNHGVDIFDHIIEYWGNPKAYCDNKKNTYEYNFVLLIQNNQHG